jgi:hypothetical protein
LSTDKVCACRPPAASTPRIRLEIERVRFNVNLQRNRQSGQGERLRTQDNLHGAGHFALTSKT